MATGTRAVALAVRAHPRGGAPSGDEASVRALRGAAAAVGSKHPEILSGPSSVSAEGTILLTLFTTSSILQAILAIADELRPLTTTFCAAVSTGAVTTRPALPDHVESSLLAAEAAATMALNGVEETDARERRIALWAPEHDPVASALADMVLASYDTMTDRQRQIISLIKESETQQRVATHLGVSRQAVNQSLAAAGWPLLRRAENEIREYLSRESSSATSGGGAIG